jgi:hypothetical protein
MPDDDEGENAEAGAGNGGAGGRPGASMDVEVSANSAPTRATCSAGGDRATADRSFRVCHWNQTRGAG